MQEFVEEQLNEAKFFVENMVALRAFQIHRCARIIQDVIRRWLSRRRQSAALLIRATRCWLARGVIRRARIRRDIRRYVTSSFPFCGFGG